MGKNEDNKRATTKDGGKITKIREINRLIQCERVKIGPATRHGYIGIQIKSGTLKKMRKKLIKPSKINRKKRTTSFLEP